MTYSHFHPGVYCTSFKGQFYYPFPGPFIIKSGPYIDWELVKNTLILTFYDFLKNVYSGPKLGLIIIQVKRMSLTGLRTQNF